MGERQPRIAELAEDVVRVDMRVAQIDRGGGEIDSGKAFADQPRGARIIALIGGEPRGSGEKMAAAWPARRRIALDRPGYGRD
jgi:hypothetical protein